MLACPKCARRRHWDCINRDCNRHIQGVAAVFVRLIFDAKLDTPPKHIYLVHCLFRRYRSKQRADRDMTFRRLDYTITNIISVVVSAEATLSTTMMSCWMRGGTAVFTWGGGLAYCCVHRTHQVRILIIMPVAVTSPVAGLSQTYF